MAVAARHANASYQLPGGSWVAACRCGWQHAGVHRTRDTARQLVRAHRTWAQASMGRQLRKRRAQAAAHG